MSWVQESPTAWEQVIKVTECRQTEDELTRNMLASTASFINCTGGVNGDSPTEITRADVDSVIQTLAGNNAYTISDNIEGEDRFGTAPVRDAYFAMGSTQLIRSIESVSGFIAKAQYPLILADIKSWVIDLDLREEDKAQAKAA